MGVGAQPWPPLEAVEALWRQGRSVRDDDGAIRWAEELNLNPGTLDRYGLVRTIPFRIAMPPWARYGEGEAHRPWHELGYRILCPLFDAAGERRSVCALPLAPRLACPPPVLEPMGFRSGGLVFANPLAVMVLQIAAWQWGAAASAREHRGDGWPVWAERRLLIVEGEASFLTWATHACAAANAIVGVGVGPGMWSQAFADAIPSCTSVFLRTSSTDAGDDLAEHIAQSLQGRCAVKESESEARVERRRGRGLAEATSTATPGPYLTTPASPREPAR